jgi:arylsulfatase A-like enzyme
LTFLGLWAVVCEPLGTQAAPRPNIVFVLADDLGFADVGYHGSDVLTPHVDRLAAEGTRLEYHYVYPVCSPTRIGLIAGRGPSRYGVLGAIAGKSGQHLPPETFTIADALRAAGYTTHISGKWHLGLNTKFGPTQYGFDTTYGYLHGQIDPYTHHYKFGDRTWHRNDIFCDEEGHATDLITNEAVRVIEEEHSRPFFLYVAYSVPHYPLDEPAEELAPYEGRIADPWRKLYAASVTHMDAGVGRIVAALEGSGQRANTLLVFASDNGGQQSWNAPQSEYDGRYRPHTTLGNNLPLRGWKGQLYEGGIRVPAVVNWPGRVPSGKIVEAPVSILDWMPTFSALAGYQPEESLDLEGTNVWPQITGSRPAEVRTFYWKTGGQLAIRQGGWKLVTDSRGQNAQLYNIAEDPLESADLASRHPQRVEELAKTLEEQRRRDP